MGAKSKIFQHGRAAKITKDQFDALWDLQGGTCAICESPLDKGRNTAVDHDHKTGQIRLLLCNLCNLGLGAFHDNPNLLRWAIAYLELFQESKG